MPRLLSSVNAGVLPRPLGWPAPRHVLARDDSALTVFALDRLLGGDLTPAAIFPAPWPRAAGGRDAVSPDLTWAVFSGTHALHAVDADGGLRWRYRHACWACDASHDDYAEYAGDRSHRYPDSGSTWIGPDGVVWAHVRVDHRTTQRRG